MMKRSIVSYRTLLFGVTAFCTLVHATLAFASPLVRHPSSRPLVTHGRNPYQYARDPTRRRQRRRRVQSLIDVPRGGALPGGDDTITSLRGSLSQLGTSPSSVFNAALVSLGLTTTLIKVWQRSINVPAASTAKGSSSRKQEKPKAIRSIQVKFLLVFWLLRCADWLQGPYFYQVYASKVFQGVPASLGLVSRLFLTGFASTALFGPLVGRATDAYGRKKGTLAFAILYALGAASTKSSILHVLLLGRVMSGIGTSLLFSAPEAWLVGETQQSGQDMDGKYLGETFGMAYAGDSVVAILAGQFAGAAASARGPTGPFELSVGFLALGGMLAALLWPENVAEATNGDDQKPTIREAVEVVKKDPKIMLVGAVQGLFEAAMYIFVLQWPPAVSRAITGVFGADVTTPFGTVFSCFMASCLLGSTLFGQLAKTAVTTEASTSAMLTVASLSMGAATLAVNSPAAPLAALALAFFAFEACVGMYFPSIGTLRSKYVPDSHRSVIMNLFGIPLNVLVVSVFLSIRRLGVVGALSVSTAALSLATLCMFCLRSMTSGKGATAM